MRTIGTLIAMPFAGLSLLFLVFYGHWLCGLWQVLGEPGLNLFTWPQVVVWRAYRHAPGVQDGFSLFLVANPPEGTVDILNFPSWWVAAASAGILVFTGSTVFRRKAGTDD